LHVCKQLCPHAPTDAARNAAIWNNIQLTKMNRLASTLLLFLLAAGTLPARAQSSPQRYAIIEYMHLPEGKSEETYLATEKLWQRLHQKAVDAGTYQAWYLERVENGGRGDFVTVTVYDSLDKMANPWPDSMMKSLFNAEEMKTMQDTAKTRDLIHRELWAFESSAEQTPGGDPSSYVWVQFMKPKEGKSRDYAKMEKDTYTKIHQARIKAGEMKNWHFMSRLFPSGMDADFEFVTINVFAQKDWKWNDKLVESVLGKEEAAKLGNPTVIRTTVREELWRPLLRTIPSQKPQK